MESWFRPGRIWAVRSRWQDDEGDNYCAAWASGVYYQFPGHYFQWVCMN